MKRARERLLDWAPVLLALPLYATALGWGWGPEHLWSWDEPRPLAVVGAPYSGGTSWAVQYPLLHRDLLRLLFGVVDPVAGLFGVGEAAQVDRWRFLAGRALTLLLALLTVRLAWLVARHGVRPEEGPRAGAIAAFAWLAVLPQTYYAKTMNLDAPYVFWMALATWAFVHLRASPRPIFSALFFAAAAAAVLTKDQAFGLFVLPAILLCVDAVRRARRTGAAKPELLILGLPMLGAAVFSAVSYRLSSGGDLLRLHLDSVLSHPARFGFATPGLTSVADRALLALRHVVWSFDWPLAAVVASGVVLALGAQRATRERDAAEAAASGGRGATLLLFPLSYVLFALLPLGYNYDRFLLPVCWMLAVVAGGAISHYWGKLDSRRTRAAVALGILFAVGWGLWRCVALDLAMAGDRRYALEAATRGMRRAAISRFSIRAPQGFDRPAIPARGDLSLAVLSPYEVVAIATRDLGDPRLVRLARELSVGACGFRRESPELARPPAFERWVDFNGVLSNLGEVDPPFALFRRDPPFGPCEAK